MQGRSDPRRHGTLARRAVDATRHPCGVRTNRTVESRANKTLFSGNIEASLDGVIPTARPVENLHPRNDTAIDRRRKTPDNDYKRLHTYP
jgi:hypothetical protein